MHCCVHTVCCGKDTCDTSQKDQSVLTIINTVDGDDYWKLLDDYTVIMRVNILIEV